MHSKSTMGLFPMVLAGEASLDQQYAALLGSVVAKCPHGSGGLALKNAGSEKRVLLIMEALRRKQTRSARNIAS